jgi:hypothetical protein
MTTLWIAPQVLSNRDHRLDLSTCYLQNDLSFDRPTSSPQTWPPFGSDAPRAPSQKTTLGLTSHVLSKMTTLWIAPHVRSNRDHLDLSTCYLQNDHSFDRFTSSPQTRPSFGSNAPHVPSQMTTLGLTSHVLSTMATLWIAPQVLPNRDHRLDHSACSLHNDHFSDRSTSPPQT